MELYHRFVRLGKMNGVCRVRALRGFRGPLGGRGMCLPRVSERRHDTVSHSHSGLTSIPRRIWCAVRGNLFIFQMAIHLTCWYVFLPKISFPQVLACRREPGNFVAVVTARRFGDVALLSSPCLHRGFPGLVLAPSPPSYSITFPFMAALARRGTSA